MSLERNNSHSVDQQKLNRKHSRITARRATVGALATVLTLVGCSDAKTNPDTKPTNSFADNGHSTLRIETQIPTQILISSAQPTSVTTPEASISPIESAISSEVPSPAASESTETKGDFIALGNENDLSLEAQKLIYTPDGHIAYITFSNETRRYFITAGVSTYAIDTNGESLKNAIKGKRINPSPAQVYSPNENPGYGYSGITSVFGLDSTNEQHLTALLHEEEWESAENHGGFRASIASVESFDGGLTWTNKQVLIKGDDIANPGERVSGAGQPDAIQIGDYLYIYHIDWSAQKTVQHPDQIYLARAKVENGTIDTNLEFYTENGFIAGQDSDLKSVIPVFTTDPHDYTALPSVSWNTDLNKYLMVIETNNGFAQTTSTDGITWETPKIFANFPQSQFDRQTMDEWYSYPTLVSDENQPNDHVITNSGTLYYSKGIYNASHHELVSRQFDLK